jgi:hypothetical protein
MARKSRVQLDGESALRNLNEIHDIALGDGDHGAYRRNATDCGRWVRAVQAAKMPLPQWMYDGNIKYFAAQWGFRP